MPVNGQHDCKMQHVLATVVKFVVYEGNMYLNFVTYCDTLRLFTGHSTMYALKNGLSKTSLNKSQPIKIA
jgi:hypothetical protein